MTPPCKDCLTITICRHRSYHMLVECCSLVYEYMKITEDEIVNDMVDKDEQDEQFKRIAKVARILKPTSWRL